MYLTNRSKFFIKITFAKKHSQTTYKFKCYVTAVISVLDKTRNQCTNVRKDKHYINSHQTAGVMLHYIKHSDC